MSSIETSQITLRLTKKPEILKQLKKNNILKTDKEGEYAVYQFDGKCFYFRPDKPVTIGHNAAKALIRSSAIIIGHPLTGDVVVAIDEIGHHELGQESSEEEATKQTQCPVCKKDCESLPKLARHLMSAHKDRFDSEKAEDKKNAQSVDWNASVEDEQA